jgi:hypothetical protein
MFFVFQDIPVRAVLQSTDSPGKNAGILVGDSASSEAVPETNSAPSRPAPIPNSFQANKTQSKGENDPYEFGYKKTSAFNATPGFVSSLPTSTTTTTPSFIHTLPTAGNDRAQTSTGSPPSGPDDKK